MGINVAIQMDPIGSINPRTDSTLAMMREAQKRGHALFYYTPDMLSWNNGTITAQAYPITLYDDPKKFFTLGDVRTLNLREMDVVLLRQDPPFNMQYITTTYILEALAPDVLVVNDPASVRNYSEKLFPTLFRPFMPPTLVSADIKTIESFRAEHKDIIIKPLYGYGGRSVLRIKPDDGNFYSVLEMHFTTSKEPLMIQTYLPDVKTGDRRLIMIDGKPGGIMGRIPAGHEVRANFRVGGSPAKAELTERQKEICEAVGPVLKGKGIIFAGLDLIGDYLTEINVTSPTGLVQMNALYGKTLEADIWNAIEARL